MNESDEGEDSTHAPIKQAPAQHKTQPRSLDHDLVDGTHNRLDEVRALKPKTGFDHARFAAGIVGLHGAVIREPIPEKMLRLIEDLSRQERQS
jgi:hypothetical protein